MSSIKILSDHQSQLLVTKSGKQYPMSIPQLDGTTTCLASNQGWLLLFQQGGSMFFFCPSIRTKIDLPKFPASELTDHVAAFLSPQTSQDCIVCVVSRKSDDEFELNALHRGANEWTQHKYDRPMGTIKCATYFEGEFYFFDDGAGLIAFNNDLISWMRQVIDTVSKEEIEGKSSPEYFYIQKGYFQRKGMKKTMGLAEDVSISTCGTQMQCDGLAKFYFNETISSNCVQESESRQFKGVWIYPRLYQTSPKYENW